MQKNHGEPEAVKRDVTAFQHYSKQSNT